VRHGCFNIHLSRNQPRSVIEDWVFRLDGPFERGVLFDLVDRCKAEKHFFQAVVTQRFEAYLCRRARDLLSALAVGNERSNLFSDQDEFVKRDAALVAGVSAHGTTAAAIK